MPGAIPASVAPVIAALAPGRQIKGQFRQQADYEKHDEADAPTGNVYRQRVANYRKREKKQGVSPNQSHASVPLWILAGCEILEKLR